MTVSEGGVRSCPITNRISPLAEKILAPRAKTPFLSPQALQTRPTPKPSFLLLEVDCPTRPPPSQRWSNLEGQGRPSTVLLSSLLLRPMKMNLVCCPLAIAVEITNPSESNVSRSYYPLLCTPDRFLSSLLLMPGSFAQSQTRSLPFLLQMMNTRRLLLLKSAARALPRSPTFPFRTPCQIQFKMARVVKSKKSWQQLLARMSEIRWSRQTTPRLILVGPMVQRASRTATRTTIQTWLPLFPRLWITRSVRNKLSQWAPRRFRHQGTSQGLEDTPS